MRIKIWCILHSSVQQKAHWTLGTDTHIIIFPLHQELHLMWQFFFLLSSQSTWWLYVVLLQINTRYKWAAAFIIHIAASLDHDNHLDSIFYTYDDNISRLSVCISKPNDLNWSMLGPIQIETRSEFIFKFNWTFQWKRRTLKSAWIKYWT